MKKKIWIPVIAVIAAAIMLIPMANRIIIAAKMPDAIRKRLKEKLGFSFLDGSYSAYAVRVTGASASTASVMR